MAYLNGGNLMMILITLRCRANQEGKTPVINRKKAADFVWEHQIKIILRFSRSQVCV